MTTAGDFGAIVLRWHSWALMARQDIRLRYQRSVIGPFWISIALGVTSLGVGLLYSEVFHQPVADYVRYLAVSFMAWNFIATLVSEGSTIVIEAAAHLRSVEIPVPVLAARMAFRNLIVLAHNFLVVAAIMVFAPIALGDAQGFAGPGFTALAAAAGVGVIALIGLLLAVVLGPFCARFRDMPQIITSILQLSFLLTPVFWRPEQVNARPFIRDLNPFYHLLELIRRPLLGELPSPGNWAVSFSILLIVAALAAASLPVTRARVSLWT